MPAASETDVRIVELTHGLEVAYTQFVESSPSAMIYATLPFRQFLHRVVPGESQYFVARRGDRIVGVLPCFAAHDTAWGTIVNSLPWYGSHGGCLIAPDQPASVRVALMRRFIAEFERADLAAATIVLTPEETNQQSDYVSIMMPTAHDSRIGQATRLPKDGADVEHRLEATCRHKTRNLVRKAQKQGFVIEARDDDAAWRFLHQTHADNMAAISGRAKPWAHFQAMRDVIPADWRRLFVVTLSGDPAAALLLFRFNRTVEYITPVIVHEFRSLQPLSFAIWHAMLESIRDGYEWWNWGGTWASQVSLHHFKEGWGAIERPYAYVIKASPATMRAVREQRDAISAAFPYYFVYPFADALPG